MNIEELKEVLVSLGLTELEAKVYLTLLKLGPCRVGAILKTLNVHKATLYNVLQRLVEKGLVGYVIKEKKRYFEASDPEQLLYLLKEKEERIKKALPILKRMSTSAKKQEVIVYYGKNGIKTALEKMLEELKPNGRYYDFGVSGLFKKVLPYYWEKWQLMKRKYKIKSYCIFNESLKGSELIKKYYGEYRFVPAKYLSLTDTMIYKDIVLLLIWTAEPPIAVRIKNKDNAESYLRQFKLMWRYAKK